MKVRQLTLEQKGLLEGKTYDGVQFFKHRTFSFDVIQML